MAKSMKKGDLSHPVFIAKQVREYRYFFLNLKPSPECDVAVACGGWEKCAPDYRVDRSDFAFYGIEYVAGGSGVLTLGGTETRLLPGSIFAYRPFTAHSIQTNAEDPLVKYFIDFSGVSAERIISRRVLGAKGVAYLHQTVPIHDLCEQIIETGLKGGSMAPRLAVALLELLSLRIEENAHGPSEVHSRARQTFERCRLELAKHFRIIHSVSDLAQRTHLNAAYLTRLFDRFVGESPYEMLIRLKLNEAAAHLTAGHYSVKEIAAQVGFSDPYHFSRLFKKHHGVAPIRFQGRRGGGNRLGQ